MSEGENPIGSKSGCNFNKIPSISPSSVFEYYTKHSIVSSSKFQPCPLTKTPFGDAGTFLKFIKYLTTSKTDSEKEATIKLPAVKVENPHKLSSQSSSSAEADNQYDVLASKSCENTLCIFPHSTPIIAGFRLGGN